MRYLLSSLFEIALLRKDPSVLPASIVLLVLTGAAFAATSALQSWILHGDDRLIGRTAYDLGLAVAVYWLLLVATRHGNRFRQTMSAIFGTTVLMTPFSIGLLLLQAPTSASYALKLFAWAGSVIVIVWYIRSRSNPASAIRSDRNQIAIPMTGCRRGRVAEWLLPTVTT